MFFFCLKGYSETLISTDSEKILFSSYFLEGIAKKNTCAKFQRTTVSTAELDLEQKNWFLVNNKYKIFH